MTKPPDLLSENAKEVAKVGFWAALAISVVTATTANAVLQAVATVAGGTPTLGLDQI